MSDGWTKASASGANGCVEVSWRKALASGANGNCVEVGTCTCDGIKVRDSKLGDASPVLTFTRTEWAAFLDGARAGEFDQP